MRRCHRSLPRSDSIGDSIGDSNRADQVRRDADDAIDDKALRCARIRRRIGRTAGKESAPAIGVDEVLHREQRIGLKTGLSLSDGVQDLVAVDARDLRCQRGAVRCRKHRRDPHRHCVFRCEPTTRGRIGEAKGAGQLVPGAAPSSAIRCPGRQGPAFQFVSIASWGVSFRHSPATPSRATCAMVMLAMALADACK